MSTLTHPVQHISGKDHDICLRRSYSLQTAHAFTGTQIFVKRVWHSISFDVSYTTLKCLLTWRAADVGHNFKRITRVSPDISYTTLKCLLTWRAADVRHNFRRSTRVSPNIRLGTHTNAKIHTQHTHTQTQVGVGVGEVDEEPFTFTGSSPFHPWCSGVTVTGSTGGSVKSINICVHRTSITLTRSGCVTHVVEEAGKAGCCNSEQGHKLRWIS